MRINNTFNHYTHSTITKSRHTKSIFTPNTDNTVSDETDSQTPLSYYKKLCSQFSGITFRLDDRETILAHAGTSYLGYQNSLNQVGSDFGANGQCSINVDVSVIKKMQADSDYEAQVKGLLMEAQSRYPEFEAQTKADGYLYTSIVILDDNGTPIRGIVQSNSPYSSEEELKALWEQENFQHKINIKFEHMQKSLLDTYLEMLESTSRNNTDKQ